MARKLLYPCLLVAVLALPFLLRPADDKPAADGPTLVIISPHNEATRFEFEQAFRRRYRAETGRDIYIDWRNIGGTSEIARFLEGEFAAAGRAGRPGIGVDLFFGGGQFDHEIQKRKGHTVPCGVRERHPEWLDEAVIPRVFAGEYFYDADDHWYGVCLSSFGIVYNRDVLRDRGIAAEPAGWADLGAPHFFRLVALADPTKSGSINKAFEMLIQQQMVEEIAARGKTPAQADSEDLTAGWRRAMLTLRKIGANTRYFTDSASKVPLDVAQGNAAAGMCIDFYGRFQAGSVEEEENSRRLVYFTPPGGSSFSADPVSLLRGAPNRDTALMFIDFTLGMEGQKLWNYRVGTPGGPGQYALRRLPVRRDFYTAEHARFCSDPGTNPYLEAAGFTYRPAWTGRLFGLIRTLIRAMCLDTHAELAAAWQAVLAAGGPGACPEAVACLAALPPEAEYGAALAQAAGGDGDKLAETVLYRDWVLFFRRQYRLARAAAENRAGGKP